MLTRTNFKAHSSHFSDLVSNGILTDSVGSALKCDDGINKFVKLMQHLRNREGNIFLIGNGGSASVASHTATDFTNKGGLKAFTLSDNSILTCYSNDYGYEHAYAKHLSRVLSEKDTLIAISSSGESKNIINAANCALNKNAGLVTLSGFRSNNPLRTMGILNYWINSDNYGIVEIGHLFFLHYIADLIALEWYDQNEKQ